MNKFFVVLLALVPLVACFPFSDDAGEDNWLGCYMWAFPRGSMGVGGCVLWESLVLVCFRGC